MFIDNSAYYGSLGSIRNDDNCIAIAIMQSSQSTPPTYGPCSQNMLIEDMVISGTGTSIGSVPPHPNRNCVTNHNISANPQLPLRTDTGTVYDLTLRYIRVYSN